MSNLSAFLNPVSVNEEKDVVVSKRFVGEDGQPVPFRIRSLTQEEMDDVIKQATETVKDKHGRTEKLNHRKLARLIVLKGTVDPDFSLTEMCNRWGVVDPTLVPGKMLLSGEHTKLAEAIMELSGFETDEDIEEQAKN